MHRNTNMRNAILFLLFFLFLASCKENVKKNIIPPQNTTDTNSTISKTHFPLPKDELLIKDDAFGDIIELTGTPHPVDQIFRVSGTEMFVRDDLLIIKNRNNSYFFMAYSLPDFRYIKSFGKVGKGPNEFQFPKLVRTDCDTILCFIIEQANNTIYWLNKNFEISELPVKLTDEKRFSSIQLYGVSPTEFYYVKSIPKGKAVFYSKQVNDSVSTTQLITLSFSDKYASWTAYIGDFGVNEKYNRLVFAYKYFKRLLFFDFKNKSSRVVSFDVDTKKKKSGKSMMDPSNITYYWGMSAQKKYLYVLYSGRTPIEVTKELNKSSGYIYVEQFDWNGNPVHKYKLDNWGYFCVNEKENRIYMVSTTSDDPFVIYKIPEN